MKKPILTAELERLWAVLTVALIVACSLNLLVFYGRL
jgi:hypothetical protein